MLALTDILTADEAAVLLKLPVSRIWRLQDVERSLLRNSGRNGDSRQVSLINGSRIGNLTLSMLIRGQGRY